MGQIDTKTSWCERATASLIERSCWNLCNLNLLLWKLGHLTTQLAVLFKNVNMKEKFFWRAQELYKNGRRWKRHKEIQSVILDWIPNQGKKQLHTSQHWDNWWSWDMDYVLAIIKLAEFDYCTVFRKGRALILRRYLLKYLGVKCLQLTFKWFYRQMI